MQAIDQGTRETGRRRYQAIPRTLIFLTSRNSQTAEQEVLLLKGAPNKRLWANRYNGLGGHVEVDEDIYNEDGGEQKKNKDGRDVRIAGKAFTQTTAMEMSKAIFSDLRQNSGATIISSAGGTEAAFEGEKWKNGLFTHCVLEGLSNFKADNNHDKKITLSELQKFVAEEVNNLSGGKQTPTYRMENTVLDYQLW